MPTFLAANLPSPPFLEHWFLEAPLVPAAVLAAAAIVALVVMNRRGELKRGLAVAAGLLVAGGAVYVLGTVVETDREAISAQTLILTNAIVNADADTAETTLADRVSMSTAGQAFTNFDREWLLNVIEGFGRQQITSSSFRVEGATLDGPHVARTQFRASVTSADWQGPHPTTWVVSWKRDASGTWRATDLNWLTYRGQNPGRTLMNGLRSGY